MTITGFLDQTIAFECSGPLEARSASASPGEKAYQVFIPRSYSPEREWPLILFLHGAGESGSDGLLQTEFQMGSAIRRHSDLFESVVVFPQQGRSNHWTQADLQMAMACVKQTCQRWRIDRRRLMLCGVSSGATGVWSLAAREPQRFAALLVVGGMVGPSPSIPESDWVVPPVEAQPYAWLAARLRHLPIWIHHGDADPLVSVQDARLIVAALRTAGAVVRYSEWPGFGHNVWDGAFYSEEVLRWLLSQGAGQ